MKPEKRLPRRILRRLFRKQQRQVFRRRRIVLGKAVIIVVGDAVFKIKSGDVERIDAHTGRRAENLSEDELKEVMRKLGVQQMALEPEDEQAVAEMEE